MTTTTNNNNNENNTTPTCRSGDTEGGNKDNDLNNDAKPSPISVAAANAVVVAAAPAADVVPYPLLSGKKSPCDDDDTDDSCSSHSSMPPLDDVDNVAAVAAAAVTRTKNTYEYRNSDDSIVDSSDDDEEEEEDYYEDEEEDEDSTSSSPCDCPRCQARDEMGEFFSFLNHQIEMQNRGDDSDDDDDDDGDNNNDSSLCDCPSCRAMRDEVSDDDDDEDNSSHSSMPPLEGDDADNEEEEDNHSNDRKKKPLTDNDGEDEDEDEDEGWDNTISENFDEEQCCTICFGPPTKKNPFCVLPCCDPNGTSSMRFCTNCMVKTLQATKTNHLEQEYGPFLASMMSRARNTSTVPHTELGECPRCRKLLSVGPSPRSSNNNSKYAIKSPTYEQRVRFAAKRDSDFRDIFFFLSLVHYHEVPVELLQITTRSPKGVTMKHIHQLVQWDIIEEMKPEKLYRIEPSDHQKVLRKIMASKGSSFRPVFRRSSSDADDDDDDDDDEDDPDGEIKWRDRALSSIGNEYFCATVNAVLGFQVKLSIYLINQCLIHLWKQLKFFPHDVTHYDIGQVISKLVGVMNLILVGLLAVVAVGVAAVLGVGYCLVTCASWLIWNSQLDDKQERRNNLLRKIGVMSFVAIWKYWLHLRLQDLICAYLIEWIIIGWHKLLSVLDIIKINVNENSASKRVRWGKEFYRSLKWILPASYLLWCLPEEGHSVVLFVMAMKIIHESGLSLKHFV